VTMNEGHRSRERARLAAARNARSLSFRSGRRTVRLEDLHLVTKDGVLELELGELPTSGERSHEPDEHEVDEGSQGAGMLPACVDHARNPDFGAPQAG
jgi:hypothetical protein